jgi:hypothetical protein
MPMSEAAMDGIAANGHRWKLRIHGIRPFVQPLADANNLNNDGKPYDQKAVEAAVDGIVIAVRNFALTKTGNLKEALEDAADNLDMVADCEIDDVNHYMEELYDLFDYHRILVS